jgi:hypothetical protein
MSDGRVVLDEVIKPEELMMLLKAQGLDRWVGRAPEMWDANFDIYIDDTRVIEDNARERFGPRWSEPDARKEALNADWVDVEGEITEHGWGLLRGDIDKLELNALAWLKERFFSVRDEGHGYADELLGSLRFDVWDSDQASEIQWGLERIDFYNIDGVYNGISRFGQWVLDGQIYFRIEKDVEEVLERSLEEADWRAGSRRRYR